MIAFPNALCMSKLDCAPTSNSYYYGPCIIITGIPESPIPYLGGIAISGITMRVATRLTNLSPKAPRCKS